MEPRYRDGLGCQQRVAISPSVQANKIIIIKTFNELKPRTKLIKHQPCPNNSSISTVCWHQVRLHWSTSFVLINSFGGRRTRNKSTEPDISGRVTGRMGNGGGRSKVHPNTHTNIEQSLLWTNDIRFAGKLVSILIGEERVSPEIKGSAKTWIFSLLPGFVFIIFASRLQLSVVVVWRESAVNLNNIQCSKPHSNAPLRSS